VVRKTVTVLFADITGSTGIGERLDPEALRRLMTRYFEVSRETLERHGATVEKFIGDAVMAVFGVPTVHEDDALRAARAAIDLREAVGELVLRIGINTGEVVAEAGETLVTGDAVNVAARLEQAAEPGEILIGDATYRVARNALSVEEIDPVAAKGKTDPVRAWRLVEVLDDAPAFTRSLDAPFVGRRTELDQVHAAFAHAVETSAAQRVTVLGAPGIGKSRLARELVQELASKARVVVGRCLAYGDGITYWPLAEIVRSTAGSDRAAIAAVAGDELVADRIAAAIGVGGATGTKEETQWAARRYLEALAAERPVVAVLDDLHWAEPTFLDLVEYVADFAAAPILLLGTARPDLLEARPAWTAPRPNALALVLEPLDAEDAALLAGDVDDETRRRILQAAEGNPLFVEQLVAMRGEGNGADIPPTIQALLAARIDSLASHERTVVERASVEGRLFHRGAVVELAPGEVQPDVGAHLLALVRKEFVRPDRAQFAGDDGYRFTHILVRDAAYDAMSKELRAELHERFVEWLERVAADRLSELEEIVAYHLEQAALFRRELGLPEGDAAGRAAAHLARSGERAYNRGDVPAARNLLERAVRLLAVDDAMRVQVLPSLGATLFAQGEIEPAIATLSTAVKEAERAGAHEAAVSAWAILALVRVQSDPELDFAKVEGQLDALLPELAGFRDLRAVVAVRRLDVIRWNLRARQAELVGAGERLLAAAREVGDVHNAAEAVFFTCAAYWFGPVPVAEARSAIARLRREARGPLDEAAMANTEGGLLAMEGNFEDARERLRLARQTYRDFGLTLNESGVLLGGGIVELAASDFAAAEDLLAQGATELRRMGETAYLSTHLAYLGDALYRLGRYDEADRAALESERMTQAGDVASEAGWRSVRARVLARRGEHDQAVRLAREAIDWVETTDSVPMIADQYEAFAEVLRLAGRDEEAVDALEHALELYERKGHRPFAERTRAQMAELLQ
jgi:class 3 adenylate cyclase/tetratricopeptide (TPR) repeat protein